MPQATSRDKTRILSILSDALEDNRSVNYVIKQDRKRRQRISQLMDYCYELCRRWGKAYISEDGNGAALVIHPHQKSYTPRHLWLDLRLVLKALGPGNVKKSLQRESLIGKHHPKTPYRHLFFIGVDPQAQGRGTGTALLEEVTRDSDEEGMPLYLETSTEANLPLYRRFGFEVIKKLDFGFPLWMMRRNPHP